MTACYDGWARYTTTCCDVWARCMSACYNVWGKCMSASTMGRSDVWQLAMMGPIQNIFAQNGEGGGGGGGMGAQYVNNVNYH